MANFGGIFHDWIDGPWDQARGPLRDELEALHISLGKTVGNIINSDGSLSSFVIQGDGTADRRYIANTGTPNNAPRWESAVYSITTDDTFIEGGTITETGEIAATEFTQAAVALAIHSLCGGI